MVSFNDRFLDRYVDLSVDVLRTAEGISGRIRGQLRLMERDLVRQIRRLDVAGVERPTFRQRRLDRLLALTRETIRANYSDARSILDSELVEVGRAQMTGTTRAFNDLLGVPAFEPTFTAGELRTIAKQELVLGGPAREWWGEQQALTRRRVWNEIRAGYGLGETNDDIVRRIRGRATGRNVRVTDARGRTRVVRQYAGGALDASTREAKALVRTSVQTVSNSVVEGTYKANSDIVKGIAAVVTLDFRTTLICIARSGGAWDLETGRPLSEDQSGEDFPGYPPWHWQCRTFIAPITRSWEELIEATTGKKMKVLEGTRPGVRASLDGEVPGQITYADWLKGKPVARQKEVLGLGRWRLWNEGKLTPRQLLDQSGRPLTTAELIRRHG